MNSQIHKFVVVLLLVGVYLVPQVGAAAGRHHIKKLAIHPLSNPTELDASYNPGSYLSRAISVILKEEGQFQLVAELPGTETGMKSASHPLMPMSADSTGTGESMDKTPMMELKPTAQFAVTGKVLTFNPDINAEQRDEPAMLGKPETAEVEAEINIYNQFTNRLIFSKQVKAVSKLGKTPFQEDLWKEETKPGFVPKTSIGNAARQVVRDLVKFITTSIKPLILEAYVISVAPEQNEVVLNVGAVNGISLRDQFVVYDVKRAFMDPLTQADLGDRFIQKGVVRVKEVQSGFALAEIMAGEGIQEGDLVGARRVTGGESLVRSLQLTDETFTRELYQGLADLSH